MIARSTALVFGILALWLPRADAEDVWTAVVSEGELRAFMAGSTLAREQGGEQSQMVFELIWDGIFDGRMDDKAFVIDQYLAHNQLVRDTVPSERLLEFDPQQGWQPLCEFLQRPIPSEPYPRTNTTEEFQQRLTEALPPER